MSEPNDKTKVEWLELECRKQRDRIAELERQLAELRSQPTAQQVEDAAMLDWLEMMANKPEGLLLHDGGDFTGRCGLGLRRIGRSLRQACRQSMQAGKEPKE